jgi:hypothetical protein
MTEISVMCVFCEDIREEKSEQVTIVGVLPDNLNIAVLSPPPTPTSKALLPKFGVYLRINLSADMERPKNVSAKVLNTGGEIIYQTEWASEVIDKGFVDTETNRLPLLGLLLKVVVAPLPVSAGKITAIVTIDDTDHLAGVLNIIFPNASQPPA